MRSSFLPRAKSVSYRLLAIQFGLDVVLGSGSFNERKWSIMRGRSGSTGVELWHRVNLAWQQRRVIFADDEEHLHFLKQLGPVSRPPSDDKLFSEYFQLQSQSDPSLPGCSNRSEFTN